MLRKRDIPKNMIKKIKVYVAGHRGLLGSAVVRQLARRADMELIIRSRDELDLLDQAEQGEEEGMAN